METLCSDLLLSKMLEYVCSSRLSTHQSVILISAYIIVNIIWSEQNPTSFAHFQVSRFLFERKKFSSSCTTYSFAQNYK